MELYPLDFKESVGPSVHYTSFNPVTNQILIHSAFRKDTKEDETFSYLSSFSLSDKAFIYSKRLDIADIVKKSEDEFGKKDGRINIPQNIFVNPDGNFQILFESLEDGTSSYHDYSTTGNLHYSSDHTQMGNIAVLSFDKNGTETGNCIIPKSHYAKAEMISYFHPVGLNNSFHGLGNGNQFKIYTYFNSRTKPYLFINDVDENSSKAKKGKLTTIQGMKDCDAYYYDPKQTGILTDRKYLFAESDKNHNNYLCISSASNYDKEKNILVTLKVKPDGKNRGMQIIWLQPE
jgi:hypothetical protein